MSLRSTCRARQSIRAVDRSNAVEIEGQAKIDGYRRRPSSCLQERASRSKIFRHKAGNTDSEVNSLTDVTEHRRPLPSAATSQSGDLAAELRYVGQ